MENAAQRLGIYVCDEVIVFGEDLPITTLAHSIDTIPYEILTGVSERVKRVFFKE
jgi:Alr-MurF fusion protein